MNGNLRICIVGGFPRAGTRQLCDVLNAHPDIELKGEVYSKSFQKAADLIEQADQDHSGLAFEKSYRKHRIRSSLNLIASISKGTNAPFSHGLKVAGFKCPRIERSKKAIDMLFAGEQIVFFYCVRGVSENYLSAKSVFDVTPENFCNATIKSLSRFRDIRNDGRYVPHVFSLNDFISSEDKGAFFADNVFSALSGCVNVDPAEALRLFGTTDNSNATRAVGRQRIKAISDEERDYFRSRSDLRQLVSSFEDQWSKSVWDM